MGDQYNEEKRSEIMSSIGSEDTDIEKTVRRLLWHDGYRYRTNVRDVPGTPDICHKGNKIAVFLDGCFWHGCPECDESPEKNSEFWQNKFEENQRKREEVKKELSSKGWNILEFWGHEIKENPREVVDTIEDQFEEYS